MHQKYVEFKLSAPIDYAIDGMNETFDTIYLKSPTYNNRKQVYKLKPLVLEAMTSLSNSEFFKNIPKPEDSESKEALKNKEVNLDALAEAYVMALSLNSKNYEEAMELFISLFKNEAAFIKSGDRFSKLNDSQIQQIFNDFSQFEKMIGVYCANFLGKL